LIGGVITLNGSGSSDPDGDTLTYSWVFLQHPPASTASLTAATAANPSFTPDVVGTYRVELTVNDGALNSQPNVVDIDAATNTNSTANAGPDQDINTGATVTLNGGASSDPDGQPLTYTWTQVAGFGPDVTVGTGSLTGASPSFTAPAQVSTIVFDLRVDDGFGESFADRAQINVFKNSTRAIFVNPGAAGNDSNAGTRAQPKRTLAAAIAAASALNTGDVYLAADNGIFDNTTGTLVLANGVSVFGGYVAADNWTRPAALRTTINGAVTGITANNLTSETALEQLELSSANAATAGGSSYGVFAVSSPGLVIRNSRIGSGQGANGFDASSPAGRGQAGGDGGLGGPGCEESGALLCSGCGQPLGGPGGAGTLGRSGGAGGRPGNGGSFGSSGVQGLLGGAPGGPGTPPGQGNWNTPSTYWGSSGAAGAPGTDGAAAGQPSYASTGIVSTNGQSGSTGSPGFSGGGGGGGGGGDDDCDSYGGGGGGGGGAGEAGTGAAGGRSAGGSFAVYLWSSNARIESTELVTGNGGSGGAGGVGQPGGPGGLGGRGALPGAGNSYGGGSEQDDGSNGGRGGDGGAGGPGGHGGGGAGGPSIGIVQANGSAGTLLNNTFTLGTSGAGGASQGNAGPNGLRVSVDTP
jgi:hypothetical protein